MSGNAPALLVMCALMLSGGRAMAASDAVQDLASLRAYAETLRTLGTVDVRWEMRQSIPGKICPIHYFHDLTAANGRWRSEEKTVDPGRNNLLISKVVFSFDGRRLYVLDAMDRSMLITEGPKAKLKMADSPLVLPLYAISSTWGAFGMDRLAFNFMDDSDGAAAFTAMSTSCTLVAGQPNSLLVIRPAKQDPDMSQYITLAFEHGLVTGIADTLVNRDSGFDLGQQWIKNSSLVYADVPTVTGQMVHLCTGASMNIIHLTTNSYVTLTLKIDKLTIGKPIDDDAFELSTTLADTVYYGQRGAPAK